MIFWPLIHIEFYNALWIKLLQNSMWRRPDNKSAESRGTGFSPLSRFIPDPESACLVYNLNVPIKKAKDPPWFAVQMGSVADSVVTNIQIIVDNTIIGRGHRHLSFTWWCLTCGPDRRLSEYFLFGRKRLSLYNFDRRFLTGQNITMEDGLCCTR